MRDHKNPFSGRIGRGKDNGGGAPVDVLVTADSYKIEVDLPGVALEDIEVTIEGGELTIHAVRKRGETTVPRKDYAFLERKFGEITRTIALPGVFGAEIEKSLSDGVLRIAVGRKSTHDHEQLS